MKTSPTTSNRIIIIRSFFVFLDACCLVPLCTCVVMNPTLANPSLFDLLESLLACWPRSAPVLALELPHCCSFPIAVAIAKPINDSAMRIVHSKHVWTQTLCFILGDAPGRKRTANAYFLIAVALYMHQPKESISLLEVGAQWPTLSFGCLRRTAY